MVALQSDRIISELKLKSINNGRISDEASDFVSKDIDQIYENIKEIKSKIQRSFTLCLMM